MQMCCCLQEHCDYQLLYLCFVCHPSSASSLSIVPLYSLKCDDRNSFGAHTHNNNKKTSSLSSFFITTILFCCWLFSFFVLRFDDTDTLLLIIIYLRNENIFVFITKCHQNAWPLSQLKWWTFFLLEHLSFSVFVCVIHLNCRKSRHINLIVVVFVVRKIECCTSQSHTDWQMSYIKPLHPIFLWCASWVSKMYKHVYVYSLKADTILSAHFINFASKIVINSAFFSISPFRFSRASLSVLVLLLLDCLFFYVWTFVANVYDAPSK